MSFPLEHEPRRLTALEPMLASLGFKLGEFLPETLLPLEAAVCHLARAMLANAALALPTPWWNRHGREEGGGWAAISHPYPEVAVLALDGALDLVRLEGQLSVATANKLRRLSQWLAAVMKSGLLIQAAADAFGLDVVHLNAESPVYQIGQGARGLHFEQASNERDALTGGIIARNKRLTALTLRKFGFPVPRGELVHDEQQAIAAIARIGFPCVVKPISMDKGAGVATSLKTEAQVIAALAHAKMLSSKAVLIENHIEGVDHRLMVAGGELLWAYRKDPASLYGDGKATVAQLIERENRNRAKVRSGTEVYRYPIITDEAFEHFLAGRYGIGSETVLPAGTRIEVAPQANIARGGLLKDVTGSVHPDNRTLAIRTARLVRLHTAGIDFMTPDISRSWKETDCAIIEINSAPGLSGMGDASLLLRTSFPNRLSGRIPTIVVIGDMEFRTHSAEVIRAAFIEHGLCLRVADYAVEAGNADGQHFPLAQAVETLLLDPDAEAALIACGPGEVERWGLPVRHCPLLIVQGYAPPSWLARRAGTVLAGGVSRAEIENAVASLARRYVDPAEGGPRPVLEPIGPDGANEYRLKVWRVRSAPRAWFWDRVGLKAPNPGGLITQDDLLAAVRALAHDALRGTVELPGTFVHEELIGSWFRLTFEAAIALPEAASEAARAALLTATERVNAIAAAKIVESQAT